MRRGFEQENLYTLSKHAAEFKNKVTNPVILTWFEETAAVNIQCTSVNIHSRPKSHRSLVYPLPFKVKVLIENDEERVAFYEALQGYQG